MKKILLIASLISVVLLLQNCKKDTVTATATSTQTLFADINDSTWTPDTLSASITYNSVAKTKVFSFGGAIDNKAIAISVTQKIATNTPGFILTTYTADSAATNNFAYLTLQVNKTGTFVYVPVGTVGPGSGNVIVTAIDSVKKVITGTFAFTARKVTYDSNGDISSIFVKQISLGAFNNLPYTFKTN